MHQHRPVPGEFRLAPPARPLRQDRLQEGPAGPLAGFREPSVRRAQRTGRHGVRPGSYVKGTGCRDASQNGLESRSRRAQPARATSRQGPLARRWPSHAAWRRRAVAARRCRSSFPVLAVGLGAWQFEHRAVMFHGTSGRPWARSSTWSTQQDRQVGADSQGEPLDPSFQAELGSSRIQGGCET